VICCLCKKQFCSDCISHSYKESHDHWDFPVCEKCLTAMKTDEVLGMEYWCEECGNYYTINVYHDLTCSCGENLHREDGGVKKFMVLGCPQCDKDVDPFKEKLVNCGYCGDLFCSACERKFRATKRGNFEFPLCKKCYVTIDPADRVVVDVTCNTCGEIIRVKNPLQKVCTCGANLDLKDGNPLILEHELTDEDEPEDLEELPSLNEDDPLDDSKNDVNGDDDQGGRDTDDGEGGDSNDNTGNGENDYDGRKNIGVEASGHDEEEKIRNNDDEGGNDEIDEGGDDEIDEGGDDKGDEKVGNGEKEVDMFSCEACGADVGASVSKCPACGAQFET